MTGELNWCFHTYLQTHSSYLAMLLPDRGGVWTSCGKPGFSLKVAKKRELFPVSSSRFTSCCLQHPAHRVQYSICGCVLASPSPTPFLRVGCRGMEIGKKKKKRSCACVCGEGGVWYRGGGGASLYNQSCLDQQNDLPPRPLVHACIVRWAGLRRLRSRWSGPRGNICFGGIVMFFS